MILDEADLIPVSSIEIFSAEDTSIILHGYSDEPYGSIQRHRYEMLTGKLICAQTPEECAEHVPEHLREAAAEAVGKFRAKLMASARKMGLVQTSVLGPTGEYGQHRKGTYWIFNNNFGQGTVYIVLAAYSDEPDGPIVGHEFELATLEKDGHWLSVVRANTPEICASHAPEPDRDAAVEAVAKFRAEIYDRLKSGELALEE